MTIIDNEYDVVIVGAGIGSLVCGCYLAKNGIKVLIVEQQGKVGGYCGSFEKDGYIFDIGVHYLGRLKNNSFMAKVLDELELNKCISLYRFNPTDILLFPDFCVHIQNEISETIKELKHLFPHQGKRIENFFEFIAKSNFVSLYMGLKNVTMSHIFEKYFTDKKLIAVFEILLGNIGLSSHFVSAVAASIMFRDYVFNGGYYAKGGMQNFVNAFQKTFVKFGGSLKLNKKIKKIILKNSNSIFGIELDDTVIQAKQVVLNTNPHSLTFELLNGHKELDIFKKAPDLVYSCSAFIVYVALKNNLKSSYYRDYHNVWYSPKYDINLFYNNRMDRPDNFIFFSMPSLHDSSLAPKKHEAGHLLMLTHSEMADRLEKNKSRISDWLMSNTKKIIGNFSKDLKIEAVATPNTLEKYTSNSKGSLYGWASIPSQCRKDIFLKNSKINGLSTVGHWATLHSGQGGITMAAYTGKQAAGNILGRLKK